MLLYSSMLSKPLGFSPAMVTGLSPTSEDPASCLTCPCISEQCMSITAWSAWACDDVCQGKIASLACLYANTVQEQCFGHLLKPACLQAPDGRQVRLRRRMALLHTLQQALAQLPTASAQLDTWHSQNASLESQLLQAVHQADATKLPGLQVSCVCTCLNGWKSGIRYHKQQVMWRSAHELK